MSKIEKFDRGLFEILSHPYSLFGLFWAISFQFPTISHNFSHFPIIFHNFLLFPYLENWLSFFHAMNINGHFSGGDVKCSCRLGFTWGSKSEKNRQKVGKKLVNFFCIKFNFSRHIQRQLQSTKLGSTPPPLVVRSGAGQVVGKFSTGNKFGGYWVIVTFLFNFPARWAIWLSFS